MFSYIVKFNQPVHGESYYKSGPGGIYNKNKAKATRFPSYYEAAKHIADVLYPSSGGLNEPATITIEAVACEDEEWTTEEILAREG